MAPPTEQLVRHYLSRLSVAARGRLSRDDTRALIDRTRAYIDDSTGLSGPATALEVGGVLSRLGDPSLVVAQEMQRLAAGRDEVGEPSLAPRVNRLARVARRGPGRLRPSRQWPKLPGNAGHLRPVITRRRAAATGSSGTRPEETGAETADVAGPVADSAGPVAHTADEPAGTIGTQTEGTQTGKGENAGTPTDDRQFADPQIAVSGNPKLASGLEALGLVGPRRGDVVAAARGDAGPGGPSPSGASTPAALLPAQAAEPVSLNGAHQEATVQGAVAEGGQLVPVGPRRPSWPHDPAIGRDVAGPGQARQDVEDQPAVESASTSGSAAPDLAGSAGETAEALVVAGTILAAEPDVGQGDQGESATPDNESVAVRSGSQVTELSTGDTRELTAVELPVADPAPAAAPRLARTRRALAAIAGWTREKTLESVATILLGVGGAIYPPIWFLGAMVALASKVWDYRDKWVGLAVPIVLTIVGTAAGVILTGSQSSLGHDLHVGWVSADISSRVSAALGAAFLAWRSVHGRRPDAVPPWNKPYRIG